MASTVPSLLKRAIKIAKPIAVALGVVALALTALWLGLESRWRAIHQQTPLEAFSSGTLGLELAPLKYILVMDRLSGKTFDKGDGRPWPVSYGFIENPARKPGKTCMSNAAENIPVGFSISNLVPVNAAGTPVQFVGLACAACHSGQLRTAPDKRGRVHIGIGNAKLDIIGWSEAFVNAVMDPSLTADRILTEYDKLDCGDDGVLSTWPLRSLEAFVIQSWLDKARAQMTVDGTKYDLAHAAGEYNDWHNVPTGPMRTRPFRSIIRNALDLPAGGNWALSKIPVVFMQDPAVKPRSQYDGSIYGPITRSMTASFASGASMEAMSLPPIVDSLRGASIYTFDLGNKYEDFSYATEFPDAAIDQQRAARGFAVYQQHCNACHGNRALGGGAWSFAGATLINKISPVVPGSSEPLLGTDPSRIVFRYAEYVPEAIYLSFPGVPDRLEKQREAIAARIAKAVQSGYGSEAAFWTRMAAQLERSSRVYPAGHPLSFENGDLRYEPGYLNAAIPYSYLRAPYLHNGSVPTMAQLINLKQRPGQFCRGDNIYDPSDLGVTAPAPDANGECPAETPFLFDTSQPGNSNAGHEYPWKMGGPGYDAAALADLMEYLKTL